MNIFIDTSALFSIIDGTDLNHFEGSKIFSEITDSNNNFVTSNYILLESSALIQRRLGFDALIDFSENLIPIFDDIVWVDNNLHFQGLLKLKFEKRRDLSLVDCISFEIMKIKKIQKVFAFDKHFSEKGFDLLK
jgi:predicted nucleic acid-binding protein